MPPELPFIELQSVDSTNNYARQQISATRLPGRQDEIVDGMAFFAHEQVAGKGQHGKKWVSQKGMNLALTILIKPGGLTLENQFCLSACVAITVRDFFAQYAGEDTRIKWPNDLYWQDRKAGGILIESVVGGGEWQVGSGERGTSGTGQPAFAETMAGKWKWAIVGIGININQVQFSVDLSNPVSLKQITGKNFLPVELAKELHQKIVAGVQQLTTEGESYFISSYNNNLYKRGELIKLRKGNRVMQVMVKEVNKSGKLIVQHGIEEEIDFGAVEWIIQKT